MTALLLPLLHAKASPTTSFLRRIAVRLILIQVLILGGMLGLVAYFGHVAQFAVARHVVESRVLGEVASLRDELASKGPTHLPHTIEKRSRLWRGFEYRLSGADGVLLAGTLPDVGRDAGWTTITDKSDTPAREILTYVEQLPDGSFLAVGQDLSAEAQQTAVLTNIVLWCGALGVAIGFAVSCLFVASGWRRVSALARAAREASTGRLDVRVRTRTHRLRDDIDELGTTFNTMLAEIGNLMSQVQLVSTAVAHDLRTPLTRVRQRIERLTHKSNETPEFLYAIGQVDADLEELSRTFDAMLRLAEIENTHALCTSSIDLGSLVTRVAEAFRPEIEDAGRPFQIDVQNVMIQGDGQLLAQAISNLLDNAIRHTPPGTAIALGAEDTPEGPVLFVIDRGSGIPQHLRLSALERFHKLDASRTRAGSGLGLAIVSAIAKRHDAALALLDAAPGLRVEMRFSAML